MSILSDMFWPFGKQTPKITTVTLPSPEPEVATVRKWTSSSPNPGMMFALGGFPSNTGIPVTPYSALQASAVYACIKVLSEDVAKLPLRVRRKLTGGGWQDATDHPVNHLLHAPNDWQTPFEFWAYLVVCHQLRGNGYAAVIRDGAGDPIKLIPLLPDRVMVMLTDKGDLFYQASAPQLGMEQVTFPVNDVIHIRNMSLDGGILGMSPISCQQDSIGLALAVQKNAATLFRQGSMIRGVLTTPAGAKLSQETSTRMAESWTAAYAGSDNAHRVALLEGGTTFAPIQMDANDAQLLEDRKFSAEEVARIFRVPQHRIGILDRATFSNIENLNQQYIDDALMGISRRIEECLEKTLLFADEREKYQIRFDFDQLLRGDFKSRMEANQIGLLNGVFSVNEVREKEGMAPVDGGDLHRYPLNMSAGSKPTDTTPEVAEDEK